MSCGAVRDLLHRPATTLSNAERLILEEHVETCTDCRAGREQLLSVREIVTAMPIAPLGTQAHQRALAKALLRGRDLGPRPARVRVRRWVVLAGVAGAAAALALWIVVGRKTDPAPPRVPEVATARDASVVLPAHRIESGRIVTGGVELVAGAELPAGTAVYAPESARLVLHAATLVLAANTTMRWSPADHTAFVDRGVVDVELDPEGGKPLRVATEKFVVEVTGTVFRVTPREVTVSRGSVRILAPDSTVLVARLVAGESWKLDSAHPAPPAIPARTWLARAHRAFTARDCKTAEQHADAALEASPTRAQTAEARIVLAECAQAAGRLAEAASHYDAIASRFADLRAGETALIAAARLEAARGRTPRARVLFERYVKRYPSGKFLDDARRFLREER